MLEQTRQADPSPSTPTLHAYCLRILRAGDLSTKLAPPPDTLSRSIAENPLGKAVVPDRPVRGPGLEMRGGADRLPRPGQLRDRTARIACLARFAHHELQAVELFAWALLLWPAMPAGLQRGLLSALRDEQRHCRLYLERLDAQGGSFWRDDHSDYFWRQAPAIAASPAGPRAFLAAMGLTLEQANLDFTLSYRDGFAEAGDRESAAVCQRVHEEEIAHVALARRWLLRLDTGRDGPDAGDDLRAYRSAVPFPLDAARAKGRRFAVAPRRRAGLSPALIEHVRSARSNAERRPRDAAPPDDRTDRPADGREAARPYAESIEST